MKNNARALLALGAASFMTAALSGCVSLGLGGGNGSGPGVDGGPAPEAKPAIEGEWLGSDGISVSTFSGGVFSTNALDTGNKLAEGSYRINGATVEITLVSLIRKTTTNVNCAQAGQNQLNCTTSTGQRFVLKRRLG